MNTAIESIFGQFIPLFNNCLAESCKENYKPSRVDLDLYTNEDFQSFKHRRLMEKADLFYNKLDESYDKVKEYNAINECNIEDDDELFFLHKTERLIEEPDRIKFLPNKIPNDKVTVDLNSKRLQVIVKLANIILTLENPKHGGFRHVEGMQNENIVATGIYYYDQKNITQSFLAFRTLVKGPDYEQIDDRWLSEVFGLEDEGPPKQYLGKADTLKDQCIVFPNLYQHQVQPFELEDINSLGYRKIL